MIIKEFEDKFPRIGERVFIAEDAVIIGDITVGDESSIWYKTVIRGDVNYIKIGKWTSVQDGSIVHVTNGTAPTIIGDYVTVGHGVKLHGCTIKDRCLIGIGAIVLDNVIINEGSIVAAGTLIPPGKEYPPGSLIMGSPGKVVRKLTEEEIENLKKHALRYVDYKNRYIEKGD